MRTDTGRFGTMHRKPANASIHLTFDTAYQYLVDNHTEMLCEAWDHIRDVAVVYSYQMLWGLDCELLLMNKTISAPATTQSISSNGKFDTDKAVNVRPRLQS